MIEILYDSECDVCKKAQSVLVEIDGNEHYEDGGQVFISICIDCMNKALALAEKKATERYWNS